MKNRLVTILLVILFLVGLSLLLYPFVSNYWNTQHQSKLISVYSDKVKTLDTSEIDRLMEEAILYNQGIKNRSSALNADGEELSRYYSMLNIDGSGIMGYIEIPNIKVMLPIYHGTDETVLQVAAGNLEWTALPVGGEGTHCVISSHRGLPSARLFTDIDQLREGDIFMIRVLNEVLTYEVDQILVVLPDEMEPLMPVAGKDYCTLVTCTPYGVNSHRLLVRGHRIDNTPEANALRVTAEAVQIEAIIIMPILATMMLIVIIPVVFIADRIRRPKKRKGKNKGEDIPLAGHSDESDWTLEP